jgi:hypothetical protein
LREVNDLRNDVRNYQGGLTGGRAKNRWERGRQIERITKGETTKEGEERRRKGHCEVANLAQRVKTASPMALSLSKKEMVAGWKTTLDASAAMEEGFISPGLSEVSRFCESKGMR